MAHPQAERPAGAGTTALVVVILVLLVINLGLTAYLFLVVHGLVEALDSFTSYFGG